MLWMTGTPERRLLAGQGRDALAAAVERIGSRARLRRERVTEEEVLAAVRAQGIAQLARVEAVVLETDGSFSILERPQKGGADTLRGVLWPDGHDGGASAGPER